MAVYRVGRTFNVRDMSVSEVTGLDNELVAYLRKRLRHHIKGTWVLGGTSGFIYSERKIPKDLVRDGHDGYTFNQLSGEEADYASSILGVC